MLNTPQFEELRKQGFIKLPGFIQGDLLVKLRLLFEDLMNKDDQIGKLEKEIKGKKFVTALEEICQKGNLAALELLGSPQVQQLAEQLCGPDYFLIQEFAVIKNAGDESPVLWHQDMAHERNGHCYTFGFYLDNVYENDGALRLVPGSHVMDTSICELGKLPYVEVPALAGDLLIHDMMTAHSSEPMQHNLIRRVVYFEFLSAAHVRTENIYEEELIERRTRLTRLAKDYYNTIQQEKGHPDLNNFNQALSEIYAKPIRARPSAYCFDFTKSV